MQQTERISSETYANRIDANTALIIEEIAKFPVERLDVESGKEWTLIEVLKHLYLTDKLVIDLLRSTAKSFAPTSEIFGRSALRSILVGDQNHNIMTPDVLLPLGPNHGLDVHLSQFIEQRRNLTSCILKGKVKIDNGIHKHPVLGTMTGVDLIHYLVYHTLRHTKQIRRIAIIPMAGAAQYVV